NDNIGNLYTLDAMKHSSAAYSILERHLPDYMLEGYMDDIIDDTQEQLYAFTFVEIDPETFENDYPGWGCTSMGFDEERKRIYLDDGKCFQHKDATQCAKEGIYKFFSLKFYGCFYENRWYIQKDLIYFGELISREDAISILVEGVRNETILNASTYQPINAYLPQWNLAYPPLSRGVEYDEFIGTPEIVAYIKQEEKFALLRAHSNFLYLDV